MALSLDRENPAWRPLHESARFNSGQRLRSKILSRTNWFKSKEKIDGYVDGGDEESTTNDEMTGTGDDGMGTDVPPKDCTGGDGGRYDQFSEKGGGGYFVQDKDGLNKEGGHWNDDGGEKTGKSKPRTTRTQRGKKLSRKMPPTVSVMFVEQTPGGQLAKLLQAAEDEMAAKTGYRIRVTEMSGSKLCHVMPNTNPWSGMMCGRPCAIHVDRVGKLWRIAREEESSTSQAVRTARRSTLWYIGKKQRKRRLTDPDQECMWESQEDL